MAEWQIGLRPADRADLRRAAAIVRSAAEVTLPSAPRAVRVPAAPEG